MTSPTTDADAQLRRALEHYRRGELDDAVTILEGLEAGGHGSAETAELLHDIGLQRKLTTMAVSFREPPEPIKPLLPAVAIALGVMLALGGIGALVWTRPWERPAQAAARSAEALAAVAPTAAPTMAPTVAPTAAATAAPTAAPTAAATVAPTASPGLVAPAAPTAAGDAVGMLAVRLPAGQDQLVRTPNNIAVIFDASGSMRAQVGERPKIAIAREALSATLGGLPAETRLAVRTYGNQRPNDCSDLSLLWPLGLHERAEVLASLGQVEPAPDGMTPIGASIEALAEDISGADGYTAVLLVSDGVENCGGDPVEAAARLTFVNPNLRVHVIGFDIGDEAASSTLQAIARVGGGSYFDARDPAALAAALQEAVRLSYRVLDEGGSVVGTGVVGGGALELPAGSYRVLLDVAGAPDVRAEVVAGGQSAFELLEDGSGLAAVEP